MINLVNVNKVYGVGESAVVALENINFEFEDGKFYSIVGKSGCGKSTLLNIIGALDAPSSGEIVSGNLNLNKMTSSQLAEYRNKNLGYVFQAFYLEPSFTVCENVEMPLVIAGVPKSIYKEKANAIVKKLGLESKLNKKVRELSGGQKQRTSIARAIVHNPKLILADEPTGNLDTKSASEVIEILRCLCKEGKTVILVTHNIEDAKKADIMIEIQDGKIINICNRYNNEI